MPFFKCAPPCPCVPGVCDGKNCNCPTHQIDALTREQLGNLTVKHSKGHIDFSDVANKSKNELFKMIYELGCGEEVLKEGVQLLRAARGQMQARYLPTPIHILQSIVDGDYSTSARMSTPIARKLISPTVSKNKKPVKKPVKKKVKMPVKKKPDKKPDKKKPAKKKNSCVT